MMFIDSRDFYENNNNIKLIYIYKYKFQEQMSIY